MAMLAMAINKFPNAINFGRLGTSWHNATCVVQRVVQR